MTESQKTHLAKICAAVVRRRCRILLPTFRRRCARELPRWARDKISDCTDFSIPILEFLDDFYYEWQKKEEWDKHFREQC